MTIAALKEIDAYNAICPRDQGMTIDDQMRLAHQLIQYEVLLGLVTDTMDDVEPDLDDLEGDNWYGETNYAEWARKWANPNFP